MFAGHVVAMELIAAEDRPSLRRGQLVLLFDLFAILLLTIGVLAQFSQLVGELVSIDLLDWI